MVSRLTMPAVACLAVFAALAPVAGNADEANASACQAIAVALPPPGTILPPMRIADFIAKQPGAVLRMDTDGAGGLSLESTYVGSLSCQRNILYRAVPGGREPFTMPGYLAGGEGALCAGDRVRLATVTGVPALLDEDPRGSTTVIDLSVRQGESWTPICELSVAAVPQYGVIERFCRGDECGKLEQMAKDMVNAGQGGSGSSDAYRKPDEPRWNRMLDLAHQQDLDTANLPTFGANTSYQHSFAERAFFPIEFGGDLLLGKMGVARISPGRAGSAELFATYRLVGEHLEPVAGFNLDIVGRILSSVEITGPH